MPEKPFNITHPSSEQMWACLQRCLVFEDPAARWERLQNLIRKQVDDFALKTRELPSLPLEYQDYLFTTIYGFHNGSSPESEFKKAAAILNVVLALEDIDRFTEIAFDSWKIAIPSNGNMKDIGRMFPTFQDDAEIAELSKQLSLTAAQELWLQHARRAVPDWGIFMGPGPWANDPRAQFISAQLERMETMSANVAGYLKALSLFGPDLRKHRAKLPGSFLPNLILLVEGETESILLPHFASLLGFDFSAMGVMLVSAGGGKQVARRYFELRDVVALPIVLFTDADAGEEVEVAAESLRENDRLHIWKDGEIEDTFDTETLVQQLNTFLQTSGAPGYVSSNEFPSGQRRTVILNRVWRARGLGNFDKIGFAEIIAGNLHDKNQVPRDVVKAIDTVNKVLQADEKRAVQDQQR